MFSSITGILGLVAAAIGAVLVAAFGLISRQAGVNSQKAVQARVNADAAQRMAQAGQEAPRTPAQLDESLRSGKF